ncbi:MAG: hypothetical protein IKO48_07935, partial [Elusimicrobia bacterium]|nr:hypothetical protein [Elusimicrobiota bacterium]
NLKKPTLILSVPYVIATIAPFVFALYPVAAVIISVTLATLTAQFLHYKYNKRQQDSEKLLNILEEEKIIRKNTRQYLRTQNIRETIKDRIQELCDDKKIDLSKDEFLQELLFTQWLCLADESILKILFEIKVDGKNSELKKKIVTEYLTAKDNYYTEREFSLFKELINSDNEDILKYLLNYPAKNFIDSFYIYVINGGREDCLDKIGDIISSTGGKLSPTNIFWTLRKYDTYKQNKDDLADENDKNYNLKCAILAKYVGDISLDDSDIDTDKIKRIFEINNTGLLNYILYGITYDSLDNFVERILSQYEEEDFNILNKVPQNELKDLLEKHPSNKIDMLTNILAMRNVLEFLDKDSLKDFLSLFYSNKELPFKKIISQVSETGKNKEQIFREQAKELDKYVKFINSKSSYIINKNIPIAEIIENTNSVEEIEKYFNLVDKYNLIFNIIRTNKTNKTNKKLYLDYRWKLALEYLNIEEDYQGEIFEYLLKTNADENSKFSQKYKNIYDLFHDFPKDSNFFKQYLFNNKNKQTYKKLFDTLIKLKFTGIASENDFLALKLLTDDNFNNTLNALLQESHLWDFHNMSEEDVIVVKYHSAIAVSRFIYDSVGSEIAGYNLSSDDIKKQIGVITELYVEALRQMGLIVLLDSHTKIYGLFNDEINAENERFNEEAIQKMLEILGVVDKMDFQPAFYKIKDSSDAHTAKVSWLGSIESLILERDEEKAYFMFRGHGNEENESNRLILNQNDEVITAQEMADALFNLATKEQDSVDLRRVTIDLSCCYSYFFAREVYNILEQKYKNYVKDNKDFKGTFPTIITEAGLETKYGHSIVSGQSENEEINQWIGNLHEGIIKVLQGQQGQQDQQEKRLTLGMLALSEYQFSLSNITMFASFDDNMTEKIEEIRETTQKVFEGYKTQTDRMAVPPLTGGRFEASILKPLGLKLADYAHIWEELFFRTAPTAVSVII